MKYNLETSQSDRINFEKLAWDAGREAFVYANGETGIKTLEQVALAHFDAGEPDVDDRHEAMAIWVAGFTEGWQNEGGLK